jgi:hypothetical protein
MFITNLLGSSYQNFPAALNPGTEESTGFQEIIANNLSEKKSGETTCGDGGMIDLNTLNTPDFFIQPFPMMQEGFQASGFGTATWQMAMNSVEETG